MSPVGLSVWAETRLGTFRLDAAFEGPARGVTALFGPSGAGKSSLLAAVAGALRPDRGRIVAGGKLLFDDATGVNLAMERRGAGWVFQDARLFPHLDVRGNLAYGLQRARDRPHRVGFDEVVAVLGIGDLLDRRPRDLSGGERQRVAMGRALLSQPRLLLMDEPLAALDAPRRAEILPFLQRLKSSFELPILYVTHSLSEVMQLADHLVVLDAGRVAAEGPLRAVLERTDLPMLAGRADVASVLDARLEAHERGLSRLDAGGAAFLVPSLDQPVGAAVRAVVLARDVLLAGEEPRALSARNVLSGVVQAITQRRDGTLLVSVALGDQGPKLLSAVTRDAAEALMLAPGVRVWAIVKSVAVEGGRLLAALDD